MRWAADGSHTKGTALMSRRMVAGCPYVSIRPPRTMMWLRPSHRMEVGGVIFAAGLFILRSAGPIMVAPDSPFSRAVTVPVSHGVQGAGVYSNTPVFRELVMPCNWAITESALPVIRHRMVQTASEPSAFANSARPMGVTGVTDADSERICRP